MIRNPSPARLIRDIRRLVVRSDHAMEEEHGVPRGITIFLHFQLPAGSRDENVIAHVRVIMGKSLLADQELLDFAIGRPVE